MGYLLADLIPHELIDYIILPLVAMIVFFMCWPWVKRQLKRLGQYNKTHHD